MPTSVSDFIIDRLIEWGLHHWYGYPGDGIGGFDGAMGRAQDQGKDFTYVRPTHEEEAAFMATAHAKFTDEVGVCVATSGPGALHLINGLYDVKGDNAPVVAIVGQQARVAFGTEFQQEISLERAFSDVAVFVQTVTTAMHAQFVIDKAVRMAPAYRGPSVVILPADVQTLEFEEPTAEHFVSRTGVGYVEDRLCPDGTALAQAAAVLNAGEKVAILVGQGAIGATDEVLAVAERLGAGVCTALLGKQVVPGDVAYHTQQLGLLGSRPSYDMMQDCDTLLMVGTNFPYGEFLPPTDNARAVQIDLSPRHLGARYPTEDPADIDAAWDQAFAADRPVVLSVKTDPNAPPLPAHITLGQASGLAKSLLTGDPATARVISQSAQAGAARLFERMRAKFTD